MTKYLFATVAALLLLCSTAARAQSATPLSTCWLAGPNVSPTVSCMLTATAHTVLVVGGWFFGGPAATPISDTLGLSWTAFTGCNDYRAGSRNDQLYLYYADTGASSGSDTISITNISSQYEIISAADFNTGMASPAPDATFACLGNTSMSAPTTISSMSGTLTHTNELVIGFGESGALDSTQMGISPGAGFGNSISAAAPNFAPNYSQGSFIGSVITPMEAIIEPSSGAFAPSFDQTVAGFWFVVGISFQTMGSPPPPPPPPPPPGSAPPRRHVTIY